MTQETHPRVGIGIMIVKDGKVLVGKRKGSHGAGEYSFPGGHLEYMESFEVCALREIEEECGVVIKNLRFLVLTNTKAYAPKHYVHIGFVADWESGEPEVREPDRYESWDWYGLDELPSPLFKTIPDMLDAYHNGVYYRDSKD
jgi:8-oxo-dGTP diphosphatase